MICPSSVTTAARISNYPDIAPLALQGAGRSPTYFPTSKSCRLEQCAGRRKSKRQICLLSEIPAAIAAMSVARSAIRIETPQVRPTCKDHRSIVVCMEVFVDKDDWQAIAPLSSPVMFVRDPRRRCHVEATFLWPNCLRFTTPSNPGHQSPPLGTTSSTFRGRLLAMTPEPARAGGVADDLAADGIAWPEEK